MSDVKLILLLMLCTALPARSAPSSRPATTQSMEQQLAEHKELEKQKYLHEIMALPELTLPHGSINDIFAVAVENDMITVQPRMPGTDGAMRCDIQGIVGPCQVAIYADRPSGGKVINALQFIHRDFSDPMEMFRHTMLFAHAGAVQISMDLDGLIIRKDVSLNENFNAADPNEAVQLFAQVFDEDDALVGNYRIAAPTFRQMRREYPRQTQEFVVPILRDLQQQQTVLAPDPRVASQVFGTSFRPDEALQKKIDAALAKFDSDDFQQREQAAKDLLNLGQPAALVLAHADRKGWSIDKSGGVDEFLSQFKSMPADEVRKLRRDPIFLLDCLYSPDAIIRASAARALETLTKLKLDPDVTGSARDQMIDRAYSKLYAPLTTRPSTTPATQPHS
jgi:hypothetical protein